eukprot:NODE_5089_length_985_cov_68.636891_g4880_i0.p1 GENE.NODE_5089_length_985_cov_68.636891_g4880_i0~~NODE_5089_length_985_cov_68.636891_g4880_i0.p1  ORF type:complete len:230 (-),score=42.41 NODE_5089_length_985_cov_68.636891_g4880_i0:203-892(-)
MAELAEEAPADVPTEDRQEDQKDTDNGDANENSQAPTSASTSTPDVVSAKQEDACPQGTKGAVQESTTPAVAVVSEMTRSEGPRESTGSMATDRSDSPTSTTQTSDSAGLPTVSQAMSMADEIQRHCTSLAESLAHVTGTLNTSLQAASSMTAEHVRVYQSAATAFAENVDQSVDSMSAFIEKVKVLNEELKNMKGLHAEIKHTLDAVESLENITNRIVRERKQATLVK